MNFKSIPKLELHAHISGSLSDKSITELLKWNENKLKELPEKCKLSISQGSQRTLEECFDVFKAIHLLTNNIKLVKIISKNVISEFANDGVLYLELRTTPKKVEGSYTKRQYLEAVLDAIIEKEEELGILVRLLISLDRGRGLEDGKENVLLAKEYHNHEKYGPYVCGIEVSGNPVGSSLIDFIPILEDAKTNGLKLSLHLLEINTDTAFNEAKEVIQRDLVDRIGHGTYLHPLSGGSEELTSLVKEKKIPLEICITSNIKSGTVKSLNDHHVKYWNNDNHPFIICTDDKGVFSTSLSEEIELFTKIINGSRDDVHRMTLAAIDAAFIKEEVKKSLIDICHQ